MVDKKKITIGVLLITLLITSGLYAVYILFDNVKFRIDADKTTLYIFNEDTKRFNIFATEWNSLWDGSSKMNRDLSATHIWYENTTETFTGYRFTQYIRGPSIKDTYYFESNVTDVEEVPIYHKIEILDAYDDDGTLLIYQWEIRDLDYEGNTMSLTGNSFAVGKVRMTWDSGYYSAKIYASGVLKVRWRVDSDYFVLRNRFYDPVLVIDSTDVIADITGQDSANNGAWASQIRWDISSVPSGSPINNVSMCLYWASTDNPINDTDVVIMRVDNQTWDESTDLYGINASNTTNESTTNFNSTTWHEWGCVNITDIFNEDHKLSNSYTTIRFYDPDSFVDWMTVVYAAGGLVFGDDATAAGRMFAEDHEDSLGSGLLPYLVVDYEDVTPPTYSDNSTNSTAAGTDIEHRLYWQDAGGLSGYIFEFCNGTWNGTECSEGADEICYQETANVTTACGGLDTGLYVFSGLWQDEENLTDGDWDTYGYGSVGSGTLSINYSKPANSLNTSLWQVKDGDATANISLDSNGCWDQYADTLQFKVNTNEPGTTYAWYCYNESGLNVVRSEAL